VFGLPVSTTHVLSSGVAGTMAANGSGLQLSTIRNIAMAWVLTLPAAMALSAGLYWLFSMLFLKKRPKEKRPPPAREAAVAFRPTATKTQRSSSR